MAPITNSWMEYIKEKKLPHFFCPGCGAGIALGALARALAQLKLRRQDVVAVCGIGCWGNVDRYINTNALHGTHGRTLAFATGVKASNPRLTVLALMGDGDGVTIGGNHLIHAARRNIDVTAIILNNYNYGMTGGQVSATTPAGAITRTTKYGNPERGIDICRLADAAGANFVARGTAYHVPQLDALICDGITKKGFSLIEVVSPCPTGYGKYNKLGTVPEMYKHLKDHAINVARVESSDIKPGTFLIGKLVERNDPDFTTSYENLRANQGAYQPGRNELW